MHFLWNLTIFFIRRDKAIKELEEAKEGQENQVKQLQKRIQELMARVEELEEELEAERKAKQKSENARKDLEADLEELTEQLESQSGATTAQVYKTIQHFPFSYFFHLDKMFNRPRVFNNEASFWRWKKWSFYVFPAVPIERFSSSQVEAVKKRDQECHRLRKEMEEAAAANDAAMASLKSKLNAQLAESQEELENVKKAKAK